MFRVHPRLALVLAATAYLAPCSHAQTRLQATPAAINLRYDTTVGIGGPGTITAASDNPTSFTVSQSGLSYNASIQTYTGTVTNWLSVNATSGSTSQPVGFSVSAKNLPYGQSLGIITLAFKGPYLALQIPVWVNVQPPLSYTSSFTENGFGFTVQRVFDFTKGAIPQNCEVGTQVAACTTGIDDLTAALSSGTSYTLTAVTLDDGNWLTTNKTSGSTPDSAIFTIDPSQIPAGLNSTTGYVVVTGPTGAPDVLEIDVPSPATSAPSSTLTFSSITALTNAVAPRTQAIPFFDSGNGAAISVRVYNSGANTAAYTLRFWTTDNNGNTQPMPVTMADGSQVTQVTGTVKSQAIAEIDPSGTSGNEAIGWAELISSGSVSGFALISYSGSNQVQNMSNLVEAAQPIVQTSRSIVVPYENSFEEESFIQIANPQSTSLNITLHLRDSAGNLLPNGVQSFTLGPNSERLIFLWNDYPQTAGISGTAQVDSTGQFSAVGLRFDAEGAFSYMPAFPLVIEPGAFSLPFVAFGGGFTTTITLYNPATSADNPSLTFYQGQADPAKPGSAVDLGFLQQPGKTTFTPTIPPSATGVFQSSSNSNYYTLAYMTGSDNTVNGVAILQADNGGPVPRYSSYLPLMTPFTSFASLPFDHTGNGYISGLMVVNSGVGSENFSFTATDENGKPAPIGLIQNDGSLGPLSPFSLPAHGQAILFVGGGARGVISVKSNGNFYAMVLRFVSLGPLTAMPAFPGPPCTATFGFCVPPATTNSEPPAPAFNRQMLRKLMGR